MTPNISPRKMPTHFQVWNFWRGTLARKTKLECFACEWASSDGNLDRAHIKARCEGGDDDAANLHLLCNVCHADSETLDNGAYWRWLVQARCTASFKPKDQEA